MVRAKSLHSTSCFLPKLPIIEHLDFGPAEAVFVEALNASPMFWNTHFFWEGTLSCGLLRQGDEFRIRRDYSPLLVQAAHHSLGHTGLITQQLLDGEAAVEC